jgi:hypothetical protein
MHNMPQKADICKRKIIVPEIIFRAFGYWNIVSIDSRHVPAI